MAQYDPSWRWWTLETPHCRVHFHQGEEQLAQRAARAAEAAHARLSVLLDHEPAHTEIVLSDDTDFANGFATTLLYPNIHLYAAPPANLDELNDYDDWLWQLVAHEYTHIVHLDDIRGAPRLVNQLFGELDVPNGVQPRWFIEGLAVFEESDLSSGGRVRSSLFEMELRAQRLEGGLFTLEEVSNDPTAYPRGATPYLYGSRLLEFIAAGHGRPSLAAYSDDYGSRLIPFALNLSSSKSLGEPFSKLFDRWHDAEDRLLDAELAQIRSRPVTAVHRLTHAADSTGSAVFLPDGSVAYLERGADRPPELRIVGVDGKGDRRVTKLDSADDLDVSPDGTFAVVARPEIFHEFSTYDDLWRIDLRSGAQTRLTHGLRTREPNVSPSGDRVVCTVNLGAGRMALALVSTSSGEAEIIFRAEDGAELYGPAFSPDARQVAFSEHHGAWRDLMLLDLGSGTVRALTSDQALDLDPRFDATGKWVLFSSDRTGVYDIYAAPLDGGAVRELTHLETGAFHPQLSRDGKRLVFTTFTADGYDVAIADVDLEHAELAPPSRADRPAPPYQDDRSVTFPVREYTPWYTLAPKWWLPVIVQDAAGPAIGAITSGSDILAKHQYAAELYYGLSSNELGGNAEYTNHQLYPAITLSGSRGVGFLAGGPTGAHERQTAADLAVDFPFDAIARSIHLAADYELRQYSPLFAPVLAPDEATPFLPRPGLGASLGAAASFSNARGSSNGISLEEGFTARVGARWSSPALGGDFNYRSATGSFLAYLRAPWALHQVLALRLDGGAGAGDLLGRSLFVLGGPSLNDPLLALIRGGTSDTALRGYPGGAFHGSRYVLASAEYRFPVANLDRGIGLLPVYLRRVSGAGFSDVGEAADRLTFRGLAPSLGAEGRLETVLAFQVPLTLRLGLARGLAADGVTQAYLVLGGGF